MTPGIYYFYEYQADKKIRNVGFLKTDADFSVLSSPDLHPADSCCITGKTSSVHVLFEKDNPEKNCGRASHTKSVCILSCHTFRS